MRQVNTTGKNLLRESLDEFLAQEYRTKKDAGQKPEEYEWMSGMEPTMDDINNKFAQEEAFDDTAAGGDYKINPQNPVFYYDGKEMTADSISEFHNGFAIVKANGQQGFIDQNGELLGGVFYKRCDDFEDGHGLVINSEGRYNYVDEKGDYLLPVWVTRASSFLNGEAMVINGGTRYKIDPQGNRI